MIIKKIIIKSFLLLKLNLKTYSRSLFSFSNQLHFQRYNNQLNTHNSTSRPFRIIMSGSKFCFLTHEFSLERRIYIAHTLNKFFILPKKDPEGCRAHPGVLVPGYILYMYTFFFGICKIYVFIKFLRFKLCYSEVLGSCDKGNLIAP